MYEEFYTKYLSNVVSANGEIKGLCPFHEDGDPSFCANTRTGQAYCHGCKWKGNAVTFAKARNIPFTEVPGYMWRNGKPKNKIVATYQYCDENGGLLFEVVRLAPKSFRQRRPDGKGGWLWNLKNVRRVLYKLPLVMESQQVIIVEGEKDVNRLVDLNLTATTNAGGAEKWREEYNRFLKDKDVVLIPDNDETGKRHVRKIANSLKGVARSIKLIELPDVGDKGDVSDYLVKHSKTDLVQLIEGAPEYEGDDLLESEKIEKEVGLLEKYENLMVLGELENGNVLIYSKDTRKTRSIDVAKMTTIDVISLAGVHPLDDLTLFKQTIAFEARKKQLWRMREVEQGIWYFEGKLLIVNGDQALVWENGKVVEKVESPIWNDLQIMFHPGKRWLFLDKGEKDVNKSGDVFERIYQLLAQWEWACEVDLKVLTALTMATPFQMIWPWRPHVYITGRRNTGKTTFFQLLECLFGKLCLKLEGNITEAGLRQNLGTNLYCVLLDEFEKVKSYNREQILKLLRVSNKGGTIPRGSSSGKPINFRMDHLVWVASIEVAMKEAADLSRFLIFQVEPFKEKGLRWPSQDEMRDIFKGVILTGLKYYKDYQIIRNRIISSYQGSLDSRLVESYAVPLSVIEALGKGNGEDILKYYEENQVGRQIQEDEERLIECIINSKIKVQKEKLIDGKIQTFNYDINVGDLINEAKTDKSANENLNLYGMSVTESDGQKVVAFHANSVCRNVLNDTEWRGLGIKDILLRIKGAFERTIKFSGRTQRAICVPIDEILKNEDINELDEPEEVPF